MHTTNRSTRAGALFADYAAVLDEALAGTFRSLGTVAVLLRCTDWMGSLDAARDILHDEERRRADRQRRPQDAAMHALAYAFHRMTLARALDVSPSSVPLVRDAQGCPRLPGTPWHTSLSHADGCVALALSIEGPVGIDLEAHGKASMMRELADSVATPEERLQLSRASAGMDEALLALWVRKESLLKACGLGMALEMTEVAAPGGVGLPLPEDGRQVWIHMLPAGSSHLAALTGASSKPPTTLAWLARRASGG